MSFLKSEFKNMEKLSKINPAASAAAAAALQLCAGQGKAMTEAYWENMTLMLSLLWQFKETQGLELKLLIIFVLKYPWKPPVPK